MAALVVAELQRAYLFPRITILFYSSTKCQLNDRALARRFSETGAGSDRKTDQPTATESKPKQNGRSPRPQFRKILERAVPAGLASAVGTVGRSLDLAEQSNQEFALGFA